MMKTLAIIGAAAVGAALVVAAVLGLGGCGRAATGGGERLVIYSPHVPAIREEFTAAFKAAHKASTGREVTIDWPDAGGASGMLQQLQDKYRQGIRDCDLVFGGGSIAEQLKRAGLLQAYKLPDELLAALPKTVAGEPLYDPEFQWYGATVTGFGLIYNKRLAAAKGLAVAEWADMARPEFFGLVGAVDAAQSGSVRRAYEIILQAYGYEKGMRILMLMGANARNIGHGSAEIPQDCGQGFLALGVCIDFYASRQMAGPGGEGLGFVLPQNLTAFDTDTICILRGAPHTELAQEFERFVMSPAGQKLWCLKKGAAGGPVKETLARYTVLPQLYKERAADLAPGLANPFELPPNTFYSAEKENNRMEVLPVYLRAMMVTNKKQLTEAWQAVIAAGAPERMVVELTEPLVTEKEMDQLGREVFAAVVIPDGATAEEKAKLRAEQDRREMKKSDLRLKWAEAFRARYEATAKQAR